MPIFISAKNCRESQEIISVSKCLAIDGEFGFHNSRGSDDGDEFFHGANFLIFFDMRGNERAKFNFR